MDDSWRFRPVQNHVCPVCSIPHFPFCPMPLLPPPPHAFDRYRSTAADFHHIPSGFQPLYSHDPPFWEHRPPLPRMPFPPEPWGVNHAPGREPFLPAIHSPKRFVQDEFPGGGIYKRMRVEDPPMGTLLPPHFDRQEFVPGRISGDDERRLNLIRNHGKQNMSEELLQPNGELPPTRIACEATQNQYRDGERSGLTLPLESTFGPPKQFLRQNGYIDHQDFPGATSSRGAERFIASERLELERTCAYDTRMGEHRNAHYGRKEFGGGSEDGDRLIVTQRHFDISFQQYDNYRDDGPSGTQELPFPVKGQQTAYPMPDYAPLQQRDHRNRHDFRQLHLPKESPYVQANARYTDPGSYHLARDTNGNGKNSSYPSSESFTEHRFEIPSQQAGTNRVPSEAKHQDFNDTHRQLKSVNYPFGEESNAKNYALHGGFPPMPNTNTPAVYPALPPSAIPAGQLDPSLKHVPVASSSSGAPPQPLFPVLSSASAMASIPPNKTYSDPHSHSLQQSSGYGEQLPYPSEISTEDFDLTHQAPSKHYLEGASKVIMEHPMKTKLTIVDACDLFKQPNRTSRPDHIVIILRGLPGSGKSYLAKALRDLEIENGGNAPRIHAMDDYFMVEVEKKVDDNEGSKLSSLSRVKKQITKKVIEYCYEPDMEEAYRSSMLKAFKKTLEEGIFTFIIVDDRNLRVADFAQFWAIAKRLGYEVYLLEAPYKDPTGCAARNVHGFALEDIQKMAEKWEEAPPLYLQLDIQLLFRGDDLNEHSIQEVVNGVTFSSLVDMDINDSDCDDDNSKLQDEENVKPLAPESLDNVTDHDSLEVGGKWDSEEDDEDHTRIHKLDSSKWSKDLDDDNEKLKGDERKINALSGLIQVYSKGGKSVHWGDQVDKSGFSIGAVKKQNSLIIGPGSGYNLASNPLVETRDDADAIEIGSMSESKKRFSEKLRAEHESLRLVMKQRRQRIGGLFITEDE